MQSTSKHTRAGVIGVMLTACTSITLSIVFAQQAPVEETVLGEMPTLLGGGYIAIRSPGFQVLNVQARGAQFVAVLNGRTSEPYDEINRPTVSPDGMHLAFWARRNAEWFVVADGKEGPPFDYRPQNLLASVDDGRALTFSPDGSRLAYSAQKGQRWLAVIDGMASPEYPMVLPPVFSPDGRRVAYAAGDGNYRPYMLNSSGIRGRVVVDGRPGVEYDEIGPVRFSADSRHVAYVARRGTRHIVVLDTREGPAFDRINPPQPLFAPVGNRLAYIAGSGSKEAMVVGDRVGPPVDAIPFSSNMRDVMPAFSRDGRRLAYVAQDSGRSFVVIDDARQPAGDEVKGFVFSPNGRRFAYWARSGQQWNVIIDGTPAAPRGLRPVAQNETPVFSPDSLRVAYVAWKGGTGVRTDGRICGSPTGGSSYMPGGGIEGARAVAVIDGVAGPEFSRIPTITFSPDGKRVGYLGFVSGNLASLMVDGQPVTPVPAIAVSEPIFSRDGRHLAYASGPDRNAAAAALVDDSECPRNPPVSVVVDGLRGPAYEQFITSAPFQPDGTFEYIATRQGIAYRVRQSPAGRK